MQQKRVKFVVIFMWNVRQLNYWELLCRVIAFTRLLYTVLFFFLLLSFFLFRRFRILLLKLISRARVPVWACGFAFWCPSACLGMWAGILVPGRLFGHMGGYLCARAPVWAHERAFWGPGLFLGTQVRAFRCPDAHLGTRTGILLPRCPVEHFQRIPPGG